jgi:thiosulfate/3-mercaptopyruvate sulfurtransferase
LLRISGRNRPRRIADPTANTPGDHLLLDARATPRYRGEVEPIDRAAGHVPGAANRPFTENLQADGRFKSPAELREAFRAVIGDRAPEDVVHMCGSGVTACHNMLAMEHAGLAGSRLYPPSWSGCVRTILSSARAHPNGGYRRQRRVFVCQRSFQIEPSITDY